MRLILALIGILAPAVASADTSRAIVEANKDAVVRVVARGPGGGIEESGTGFIISQDGYVVTVNHLRQRPFDRGVDVSLYATIGGRAGSEYKLEEMEADKENDVALWRLPELNHCLRAVRISASIPRAMEQVLVLGFPGNEGLSSIPGRITTSRAARGLYKTDARIQEGVSGAPVFDETGSVIAVAKGGTTREADLVPISRLSVAAARFNVITSISMSAKDCSSRTPAELYNAQYRELQLKPGVTEYLEVGQVRDGQDVSVCLGLWSTSEPLSSFLVTLVRKTDVAPGGGSALQPPGFVLAPTERDCTFPRGGKGTLYLVQVQVADSYRVTLRKITSRGLLGFGVPDDRVSVGIGFGIQ